MSRYLIERLPFSIWHSRISLGFIWLGAVKENVLPSCFVWCSAEGVVRWSEVCFCATPLRHEKETVYDHLFEDLETNEVED